MGVKYVKDFEFPSDSGFSGSCGMMKGGNVNKQSTHQKMVSHGKKMGYAQGGQVKRSKMDSMDHGVQPAKKGTSQQEIEAGGTPRLKPGYAKGGRSKKNWIEDAVKKPGALRKSMGVKKGDDIPAKKLAAAAKKPGKMGQRARLAETLKKMPRKAHGGAFKSKPMCGRGSK